MTPSLTRNDLAWLATHEDVESRIVFRDGDANRARYRVEHGPFDESYLRQLPKRNWTLLVHDVEKHLPAMRRLLRHVSFIPDWRIDDLMISFAAPGGGVGPHRDNYDVFLCQGIGMRDWSFSDDSIPTDPGASDDLLLLQEFGSSDRHLCKAGDVLYLPPKVAHWGIAKRACMTYSIGMRAPLLSEVAKRLNTDECDDECDTGRFYEDRDLELEEAQPGLLSARATTRLCEQLTIAISERITPTVLAETLGQIATETKSWLTPMRPSDDEVGGAVHARRALELHGMARIAFDSARVFVNGEGYPLHKDYRGAVAELCEKRRWQRRTIAQLAENERGIALLRHLATRGAFNLNGYSGPYVK